MEALELKVEELKSEIHKGARAPPVPPTSAVQQQLRGLYNKK